MAWTETGGGDHGGADWAITSDITLGGYHYNVGILTVTGSTSITVSTLTGHLRIDCIDCNLSGSGSIFGNDKAGNAGLRGVGGTAGATINGNGGAGGNGGTASGAGGGTQGGGGGHLGAGKTCLTPPAPGGEPGAAGDGGSGGNASPGAGSAHGTSNAYAVELGGGGGGAGGGGGGGASSVNNGETGNNGGTVGGNGGGTFWLEAKRQALIRMNIVVSGQTGATGGNGGGAGHLGTTAGGGGGGTGGGGGAGGTCLIKAPKVSWQTFDINASGGPGGDGGAGGPDGAHTTSDGFWGQAGKQGGGGGGGAIKIFHAMPAGDYLIAGSTNVTGGAGSNGTGDAGTYKNQTTSPATADVPFDMGCYHQAGGNMIKGLGARML